jgi:hypothetical protein
MSNNDLMTEIDEAMKREQLEKSLKEYGPYIAAGCVLAILITGLSAGWNSWSQKNNAAQTAQIIAATEKEDRAQAFADMAPRLDAKQELIARLGAAGLYLQNAARDDARKQFEDAASARGGSEILRQLALLQAVRLEWDQAADKADIGALLKKLSPLTADAKSPWYAHARIEAAQITANGLNDYKSARTILAPVLALKDIPDSLKQRAEALDHLYELKGAQESSATPADTEKTETQG